MGGAPRSPNPVAHVRRTDSYALRDKSPNKRRSPSNDPRNAFGTVNTTCRCDTRATTFPTTFSPNSAARFA